MQNIKWYIGILLAICCSFNSFAQGPPITADKPIMLGANSWVVKSLTEIRNTSKEKWSHLAHR